MWIFYPPTAASQSESIYRYYCSQCCDIDRVIDQYFAHGSVLCFFYDASANRFPSGLDVLCKTYEMDTSTLLHCYDLALPTWIVGILWVDFVFLCDVGGFFCHSISICAQLSFFRRQKWKRKSYIQTLLLAVRGWLFLNSRRENKAVFIVKLAQQTG